MEIFFEGEDGHRDAVMAWAIPFATAVAEASPAGMAPDQITAEKRGRDNVALRITHPGFPTVCISGGAMGSDPRIRGALYAQWACSEAQRALFAEARDAATRPIAVARAGALAAATLVDSAGFAAALREAVATSTADGRQRHANVVIGRRTASPAHGLSVTQRHPGGAAVVRMKTAAWRFHNATFTPQSEIILPRSATAGMAGVPFDAVVDHPAFRGASLIIREAACTGGVGANPARISFHLENDEVTLDEAVAIIDARRATSGLDDA